jgi:hypothetical protein
VTDYKIEPDERAILALQRVAGARVHEANGTIHTYKLACCVGDEARAEAAKREMWRLAVMIQREQAA